MAGNSASAPEPSKHVFLSELPNQNIGVKVRFLGCVYNIDEAVANLEVEHRYPNDAVKPKVTVNYDLVTETVKRDNLQIGAWINIIGYVRDIETVRKNHRKTNRIDVQSKIHIQAVLIWSAGAIRVSVYEEVLEQQRLSKSRINQNM